MPIINKIKIKMHVKIANKLIVKNRMHKKMKVY